MTSNPALLHNSLVHEQLLDWLEAGIAERVPMLTLTGDAGTGKTTLLRELQSRHRSDWIIGRIWHLYCRGEDIRLQARRALGLPDRRNDTPVTVALRIRQFAEAMRAQGKFTVLIVDDAQALEIDSISALASLTTGGADGSALTVLLSGLPELRERLAAPELRDLPINDSAFAALTPLNEDETADYVAHRLAQSGAETPIFDAGSIQMLHGFSQGVPRQINIMADHCLTVAAAEGLSQLDAAWVEAVLHDATTVVEPDGAGTDAPLSVVEDALVMPEAPIPEMAQYPTPLNEADDAENAITPVAPVLEEASLQVAPSLGNMQAEPPPPTAQPDAADATPEPVAGPYVGPYVGRYVEAAPTDAPSSPLGPAPLAPWRNPGKRRNLSWIAAAATMAVAGATFLWLQQGAAPAPVASVTAKPSTNVADQQPVLPAPKQSVPLPAAAPLLPLVAITPEPKVNALMKQALETEARDPPAAAVAYARAAIRGGSRAAYFLGQLYETGMGADPSLGSARLWYGAASGLDVSLRRLEALPDDPASAGPLAAPVPIFHARLSNGTSEMIWRVSDGVTPVRFRVDALGPAEEPLPPQETTVPGLILKAPVSAWQVTGIGADGRESPPSALVRMIPAKE